MSEVKPKTEVLRLDSATASQLLVAIKEQYKKLNRLDWDSPDWDKKYINSNERISVKEWDMIAAVLITPSPTNNKTPIRKKTILYQKLVRCATGHEPSVDIPWKSIQNLFEPGVFFETKLEENYEAYKVAKIQQRGRPPGPTPRGPHQTSELLRSISSYDWRLYCFWERAVGTGLRRTKQFGIQESRIQFTFDSNAPQKHLLANQAFLEVNVKNEEGQFERYKGICGIRLENGHLYLESSPLRIEGRKDRHLRLMLYFGNDGTIGTIAIGVYYNVRRHGALYCGSSLLVRGRPMELDCVVYRDWDNIDNDVVRAFFEKREQNFIKLPRINAFNLNELSDVLSRLKPLEKEVRIYEFDFFLSVPLTSTRNYVENHTKAKKAISIIKEELNLGKHIFTNEEFAEPIDSNPANYLTALNNLERSRCLILLLPVSDPKTRRISSVFTELGYAMGLKKPIIILCDNELVYQLPGNYQAFQGRTLQLLTFDSQQPNSLANTLRASRSQLRVLLGLPPD